METAKPIIPLGRIKPFLKQIQQLASLELFEKWFGFAIKLLWIALFIIFGIYLRKEYKKDIFYIQDFKVPPAWVEQGYSGEVVKQAIIDDIDNIRNTVYADEKSITGANEDGTEILSDFSIEGLNLKAVTKSILSVLGKKHKSIGGYVTLTDSTQRVSIRVTDQITQPIHIKKAESAQSLIRKAALEIMKVKSPAVLIAYYARKTDTTMVKRTYNYMTRHRDLTKDYFFYTTAIAVALFEKQYNNAFAWVDSAQQKFPNDKLFFYDKAKIHAVLAYSNPITDSVFFRNNKKLYIENLRKAREPERTAETESNIDEMIDDALFGIYYSEKDYRSFLDIAESMNKKRPFDAEHNNLMAYGYIGIKNYKKAEMFLQKAIFQAGDNGNYWDSLAELYSLQNKDSLAVIKLATALKCPQKSPVVSVAAYLKDPRWQRLQKRGDFQALMKRKSI